MRLLTRIFRAGRRHGSSYRRVRRSTDSRFSDSRDFRVRTGARRPVLAKLPRPGLFLAAMLAASQRDSSYPLSGVSRGSSYRLARGPLSLEAFRSQVSSYARSDGPKVEPFKFPPGALPFSRAPRIRPRLPLVPTLVPPHKAFSASRTYPPVGVSALQSWTPCVARKARREVLFARGVGGRSGGSPGRGGHYRRTAQSEVSC